MILAILLVFALAVPLDLSQGRRRRRSEQRRVQRIAACLALAGAALALTGSCAMTWWETRNSRVFPPEESVGRLGGEPVVTLIVAAIVVAGLLRLAVVVRKLPWGAASAQVVTWILFLVGIFVGNPQIGGTDVHGDLEPGYFVGLVAAGLVTVAGVVDWPLRPHRGPADGNATPASFLTRRPAGPRPG